MNRQSRLLYRCISEIYPYAVPGTSSSFSIACYAWRHLDTRTWYAYWIRVKYAPDKEDSLSTMTTQTQIQAPRNVQDSVGTSTARRTVASYNTYREAQRAVDYLSDQRFPVERVAIVAEGLRFEEQVTGRLGWGRALLNGALGGAATGLFIGFVFGLFSLITPLVSALVLAFYGLIFGAIIGAIFGLLFYAFSGGQRDFTSVGSIRAQRYDIVVDGDMASEAERLLAAMGTSR
jgi:hypothetical protein